MSTTGDDNGLTLQLKKKWDDEKGIATRWEKVIVPWFAKNASVSTFSSRTLSLDGVTYPKVTYCSIPGPVSQSSSSSSLPILVFVPGWSESLYKYQELLHDASQKLGGRVDLWCMDHCSQGTSGRWAAAYPDRGWTSSFDNYVLDVEHFVREVVLNGKPRGARELWVFGHSMGGCITPYVVARNPGLFTKVVLSAPMMDTRGPVPLPVLRVVAYLGTMLGKKFDWVPGAGPRKDHVVDPVPKNECCSCQRRLDFWSEVRKEHKSCVVGGVTWGWLNAGYQARIRSDTITWEMVEALEKSEILLMQMENETIVLNEAMDEFDDVVRSCELFTLKGSKHEFFMESDELRNKGLDKMVQFLTSKEGLVLRKRKASEPFTKSQKQLVAWVRFAIILFAFLYMSRSLYFPTTQADATI